MYTQEQINNLGIKAAKKEIDVIYHMELYDLYVSGLTEEEANLQHLDVKITRFPWSASGRAATMASQDGLTKLVLEPETGRILGAGIVGRNAEALIAESVLAIEMGALAEDIALSIHPHPTLSETEAEAAEIFFGSTTHFIDRQAAKTQKRD